MKKDKKIKDIKELIEEQKHANYSHMDDIDILKDRIQVLEKLVFELINIL